ncbi:MAG: GAF domain-containing protein [Deltaproteobacteria bacterium]|nr:GAF domain-containing protein [Deltaproteobacteria bacterium]
MTQFFETLSLERRQRAMSCLLGCDRLYVIAFDREGKIFYSDGQLLSQRGLKPMQLAGTSVFDQSHDWPGNIDFTRRALQGEKLVARGSVNEKIVEMHFTPFQDGNGDVQEVWGVAIDVTEAQKISQERDFLLEANRVLSDSLDYDLTLDRVARLALGVFADYCLIRLVDEAEPGQLRLVAVAHVNPRQEDVAFELHRRYTRKGERSAPLYQVLDTKKTAAHLVISEEMLTAAAASDQERHALVNLAACSSLLVPLVARGQCLGIVTFSRSRLESGRHYTEADIRFAEELARCMALAVERALLFRKIAQ